jgi:hypothetical protein
MDNIKIILQMIKIKSLYIALILLLATSLSAQNKLWLANGKMKEIGEYNLEKKDFVIYKNKKGKFKSIERFDVFSIIDQSKNEQIIYLPDSVDNESFTVAEMRAFVQGEYDAHQNFKSPLTTIGGAGISGGAAVFISPIYSPLIPAVYCGVIGATKTSEKKIIIPKEYENNDHYLLGYKKATKQKRVKNAIFGSLIGLAAGVHNICAD